MPGYILIKLGMIFTLNFTRNSYNSSLEIILIRDFPLQRFYLEEK